MQKSRSKKPPFTAWTSFTLVQKHEETLTRDKAKDIKQKQASTKEDEVTYELRMRPEGSRLDEEARVADFDPFMSPTI